MALLKKVLLDQETKYHPYFEFIEMNSGEKYRKRDHIDLTDKARVESQMLDNRFMYEPLLSGHPHSDTNIGLSFLGKELMAPIWVSSMTGGTALAKKINTHLAMACREFGLGMGLGSCRSLLTSDEHLMDFDVRDIIGEDLPLYINLGIAQMEQLITQKKWDQISGILDKLRADGLIIHVNPLQEWVQPEGDRIQISPIQTIENTLMHLKDVPIIVKEVGQGMGYHSLKQLLQLPLEAVEFGAAGGTNFTKLELERNPQKMQQQYDPLTLIGHNANDMVGFVNVLKEEFGNRLACQQIIISGGIKHFLDGYYLTRKSKMKAIYGQASKLLQYAKEDYGVLQQYLEEQISGLKLAQCYLRIKEAD